MTHRRRFVVGMCALMVCALGARVARAEAATGAAGAPGQVSVGVQLGWDAPPREWNPIQRQGFHDGIEGARRDFENHRPPNVENRDEYRRPELPPEQREAYREGFRRGYWRAMANLTGTPPPEMHVDWDTVPEEFNDMQRRGFLDGIKGAQRDFENHRQPNVENRDEFRHPDVPGEFREAYRDGFRRGYNRGWAHLTGQQWKY